MDEIRYIVFFIFLSINLFGQYPAVDRNTDSIYVEVNGRGSFSDFGISLSNQEITLHIKRINEDQALKMRQGDTTITLDDLYESLDTTIQNDTLYQNIRLRVYYWLTHDNVSKVDTAMEYTELGVIKLCTEAWQSDWGYQKKIMERCYYRVLGPIEYDWLPGFRQLYWDLYELHKTFDKPQP